ncbi:MFS transporter [Deinococcus gobiensis]|uniref:Permease, putative n=1 Tax=Deinococcus gobiensis (strain DSM 21396 / JCM 16679 / CGMCC 1.7299 / I-0) TaxID=745776 RepID=H8H271_DEIGI|nr:MFS transporter [Deinococcus gobiensis]AFD27618.1 Permease, putative [Deinococcus gobiensis I-0]
MTPVSLWNRSFVLWLVGSAQSRFAAALASIALSFLVLHQTGRAGQMAVTLACALIPNLVMPLAGAWVDRIGLKRPLIGANVVRGLLQLTVGGLALLGQQTGQDVPLWVINGAAFLTGLSSSVASPAAGAALPALVAPADLPRANGMMGSLAETMGLLGTFSGGFLVAAFSPAVAILLDGLSFLLMATLLLGVTLPNRPEGQPTSSSLWQDLRAGLRLMRRSWVLTVMPPLVLLVNAAIGPVLVVTPKLMETLGVGPRGYGLFLAMEGAGMLLIGVLFASLGSRLPLRACTLLGFLLSGVAQACMWLWPTYVPLLAASLVFGLGIGLINTPLGTLLQQGVPAAYLGRVFAVLSAVGAVGMPLTLLLVSPLVDRWPLSLWFGLNAVGLALGGAVWGALMRIEPHIPALAEERSIEQPQPRR